MQTNKPTRSPGAGRKPSPDPIDRKKPFYLRRSQAAKFTQEQVRRAVEIYDQNTPDGPDPSDEARDYNDMLEWAEQPTPYDP